MPYPNARDVGRLVECDPSHDLGPWMHDSFALWAELQALFGRPLDRITPKLLDAAENAQGSR